MTGKGTITHDPNRRLRLMLGVHALWIALVCLLGGWWRHVMLQQAAKIAELSRVAGIEASAADLEWARTQRMLYGESMAFFGLLLGATLVIFWLYWRENRRVKALEAFFASVTHELKTPLTSIRLQAESIAEYGAEDGAAKEVIQRLLEDTMRLEGQVERTLELARVEGGGQILAHAVYAKPWLEQFLRSWKSSYAQAMEFEVEVEDLAIEADPGALQVIFRNLFENSLRHSGKKDGRVAVAIESSRKNGGVQLSIRDNGTGFVGEAGKLGELFRKGKNSQGAGVGLYLVKVLMEKMGGRANFVSERGFEAVLWFPAAKAEAELESPNSPESEEGYSRG